MGTGPHLGGGPGPETGPDPAGRPPWARLRPPPAPAGASSPLMDARWGPRSADGPSGVLRFGRRYLRVLTGISGLADAPRSGHIGPAAVVGSTGARPVTCSVQLKRG